MPKLTRARTTPPPATAALHVLRRAVDLLGLRSPTERGILRFILSEGRDLRWTMYKRANMAGEVGVILGVHLEVAKRSLRNLVNRGWVRRGIDSEGQRYLQLTPTFVRVAVLADQRMKVRRAVGPVTWKKINGSDELADALHELSLTMPQQRYKARVNAAAGKIIDDAGTTRKPGSKVNPRRKQSEPSKEALRTLRGFTLIPGKGA